MLSNVNQDAWIPRSAGAGSGLRRAGLMLVALCVAVLGAFVPVAPRVAGAAATPPVTASSTGPQPDGTVGIASAGNGSYWQVSAFGNVFPYGAAPFYGSHAQVWNIGIGQYDDALNQPVVAIASTSDAEGYWVVAADGGVFAFGNARFYGSMGGRHLNAPVVGIAPTPDNGGYWEVAADGGVFAFGDAQFYGSMGGRSLNQPVVGMAVDPATGGYWEVAADGGVFSFGAPFYGSTGNLHLNQPVVAISASTDGYRVAAADGGIFAFGDATFDGSLGGQPPPGTSVVAMATDPATGGYWLAAKDGQTFGFDAPVQQPSTSAVLPGATAPPATTECWLPVVGYADGTAGPLDCAGSGVNVLAWMWYQPLNPQLFGLGPSATRSAVVAAMCQGLPTTSYPIEEEAVLVAGGYYGWTFAQSVSSLQVLQSSC